LGKNVILIAFALRTGAPASILCQQFAQGFNQAGRQSRLRQSCPTLTTFALPNAAYMMFRKAPGNYAGFLVRERLKVVTSSKIQALCSVYAD
jgi:hypothetical protein